MFTTVNPLLILPDREHFIRLAFGYVRNLVLVVGILKKKLTIQKLTRLKEADFFTSIINSSLFQLATDSATTHLFLRNACNRKSQHGPKVVKDEGL